MEPLKQSPGNIPDNQTNKISLHVAADEETVNINLTLQQSSLQRVVVSTSAASRNMHFEILSGPNIRGACAQNFLRKYLLALSLHTVPGRGSCSVLSEWLSRLRKERSMLGRLLKAAMLLGTMLAKLVSF